MLYREVTPTGLRGALIGLIEGALIVGIVLGGWLVVSGKPPDLPLIASLSAAGGVVLALGRGLSGGMFGTFALSCLKLSRGASRPHVALDYVTNWRFPTIRRRKKRDTGCLNLPTNR